MISQANLNAYEAEARLGARWSITVSCKDLLELIEEVKANRIKIKQDAKPISKLCEFDEF